MTLVMIIGDFTMQNVILSVLAKEILMAQTMSYLMHIEKHMKI